MTDVELPLGGVERRSLKEQSLEKLRSAIETGTLAPGQRLVETQLSKALTVSRGTLREAAQVLIQEGLIATDERGRMVVRVLTQREVHDIFAVRSALECLAARTIALSDHREESVLELEGALEPLREAGSSLQALMDADMAFHRLLIVHSRNETLLRSWDHILGSVRATITRAGVAEALRNMGWDRHIPLVRAIATGDPDTASQRLQEHHAETAERLADLIFKD
ncbi:GntR family transcriptional regulator [Nocardiopsis sp. NPDC006938]|uniref:GntR family transcriptional regulator n=1 Tax=Nocardiopsis sp. NPDC006938 TaxID=3364337 RepID=UPI003690995E